MAHQGFACLGGAEIINNARASAYSDAGWKPAGVQFNCGSCGPEMGLALEEENGAYNNPWTDDAPWLSTSEPDSYEFGGFMVTSIDGLGPGQISRSLTQRANGRGSFIGSAIQAAPVITVNGVLFGRTCCSVDYGMRWLSTILQGSCDADCDGDELTFLDCCPEFCDDSEDFVSFPDCLTPYLRYLRGVQLVASPTVVQRYGSCCGCCNGTTWMTIQFQLAASHPCVYRDPVMIAEGVAFGSEESDCPEWVLVAEGGTCPEEGCVELDDCVADPNCNPAPKPPTAPAPSNPCVCDPLITRSVCVNIPAGTIPEYTEGLPLITIRAGTDDLRQVRVKFWLNNLQVPVDQLDPCDACGEVTLSRIPGGSEFVFDGSERSATITCPGSAPTDASPLMGSTSGALPISWPEIQCADASYTVCIEADSSSINDGGLIAIPPSIDVAIVPTECYG